MGAPSPHPREAELHQLTLEHARLREELEAHLLHLRSVEERFLAARPDPDLDDKTRRELKRKMVLARPWREELNDTYRAVLVTANELARVIHLIHSHQAAIAHESRRG